MGGKSKEVTREKATGRLYVKEREKEVATWVRQWERRVREK